MPPSNTFVVWSPTNPDGLVAFASDGATKLYGPLGTVGGYMRVQGTPIDTLRAEHPGWKVEHCELNAGEYHPRMYRGEYGKTNNETPLTPLQQIEFAQAAEQEDILLNDLRDICRVVAPDVKTHQAYGSRIRNLLIMACTEIEAQWKGILVANGYKKTKRNGEPADFTTKDYFRLFRPMRLAHYLVACSRFKTYRIICPFGNWNDREPSKSLPWYDAYNATKHDRVNALPRATLEHAIDATAALCVLLVAQYGMEYLRESGYAFFTLKQRPTWQPTERCYAPIRGRAWKPIPYAF